MSLSMMQPSKRPGTGIYQMRLSVPKSLQPMAFQLFGIRSEFLVNLNTKDCNVARSLAPQTTMDLQAKLETVRRAAMGSRGVVSERDIQAIAGSIYLSLLDDHGDDPGTAAGADAALEAMHDTVEQIDEDPEAPRRVHLSPAQHTEVLRLLAERGLPTDAETVDRAAGAVWRATYLLMHTLRKRASGDWSPDRVGETFPTMAAKAIIGPKKAQLAFETLLTGWAADNGHASRPGDKFIKRSFYDRKRTLERLAIFLGHRDAVQVTKADAVRWKEDMQARDCAVATIRNDLSEMSAMWKWGTANGKLTLNPFERISPPKPKSKNRGKKPRAFTRDEAIAILTSARAQLGYSRWLPWLCCFTGARLAEATQGYKEDLAVVDGVPVLRIHDDGDEDSDDVRSMKNEDSRRSVPIHPALIAEGFLEYVAALPDGSPLFPDAKPDKMFGLRATNSGKKISRWLKETVGINDPRISPNHSWRHYFIEACRGVAMHSEVRSALTGHSAKLDESAHYGASMRSFIRVLAEALATVPSPLEPPPPQESHTSHQSLS